jgi:hypothetical protein
LDVPAAITHPTGVKPARQNRLILGGLAVVAVLLISCSRQTLTSGTEAIGDATNDATPSGSESGGITSPAKVGQSVTIQCDGINCLKITVTAVQFVSKFTDPDGYYDDTPDRRGQQFMAAKITYVALDNAVSYNPFDWSVFVDGEVVDTPAFIINGPKPDLGSGQLPKGRKASGWIVYEVSTKGEVLLSYAPNFSGAPVFEVVVRKR